MTQTEAPFTPAQIAALAWLQRGQVFAAYECPHRVSHAIVPTVDVHAATGRLLKATDAGLVCPGCGWVRTSVPAAVMAWAVGRMEAGRVTATVGRKRKEK